MAKLIIFSAFTIFSLLFISCNAKKQDKTWFQNLREGNENSAELHFYSHYTSSGDNMTAYEVARSSITDDSATLFGLMQVVDDPLTTEPDINSTEVGRLQGVLASTDLKIISTFTNVKVVFTDGSTISILGRNPIDEEYHELAVVGGTGGLRGAHGYAITRNYFDVPVPGNSGILGLY